MTEALLEISKSLGEIVEKAGPSVVRVHGRRAPASGVLWSEEIVATSNHALEWDEDIEVTLHDGRTVRATVAGRDPTTDLAALKIPASGVTAASWHEGNDVKTGELVVGLSRPGRSTRADAGIINVAADPWHPPAGGRIDRYVETTLSLHRGFSGGLLLDAGGNAIGINTAGLLRGRALAVPSATVKRVVEYLMKYGGVERGYFGLVLYPVRLQAPVQGQTTALLTVSVQKDSPAAGAGLLLGDAILSLDGQPVKRVSDLLPFLGADRIGATVNVSILRAGKVEDVAVTVAARGKN